MLFFESPEPVKNNEQKIPSFLFTAASMHHVLNNVF